MTPSQIPGLADDATALHATTHQTVIFAAWMFLGLALLAGASALWGDVIAPWIARVRKNRLPPVHARWPTAQPYPGCCWCFACIRWPTPRPVAPCSLADTVRLEAAEPHLPQEHTP